MKKLIAILMILSFMTIGCAGVKDFLCKPTQGELSQAQVYLSRAIAVLEVLKTLPQVPAVVVAETALGLATSTFQSILSGVCVKPEIISQAAKVVDQQEQVAVQLKAQAMRGEIK